MILANLSAATGRLRDAVDVIQAAWAETRVHWNDGNSQKLDEKHMRPIGSDFVTASAAIQSLADVLARAERECGPRQNLDESDSL